MSTHREPDNAAERMQDLSPDAADAEGVKGGMDVILPKVTTPVLTTGGGTGGSGGTNTSTGDGGFTPMPSSPTTPTIQR